MMNIVEAIAERESVARATADRERATNLIRYKVLLAKGSRATKADVTEAAELAGKLGFSAAQVAEHCKAVELAAKLPELEAALEAARSARNTFNDHFRDEWDTSTWGIGRLERELRLHREKDFADQGRHEAEVTVAEKALAEAQQATSVIAGELGIDNPGRL